MARTSRGNANINSLLKANMAARDSQLAYNDQAAAYNWDLSAKTDADLKTYLDYLNKRQGETQDPSKQLTVQSKIVNARRTFTSAEVSRQTISVLYGDESNTQKYARINALMQQAADTGDASLFQTLDQTRARLSETIQNQAAAGAARGAANARSAAATSHAAQLNDIERTMTQLKAAFQQNKPLTNPDGSVVKVKYDKNGAPALDAKGNIIGDPNGQPMVLNAQTYARLHGHALAAKAQSLQDYINAGGDNEQGTKAKDLENLIASKDFQDYATPEAFARNGGSQNPFVSKIDENGNRTIGKVSTSPSLVKGKDGLPALDENGQLQYNDNPVVGRLTGKDGNVGDKYVDGYTMGGSANGPKDRYEATTKSVDLGTTPIDIFGDAHNNKTVVGGYGNQAMLPIFNSSTFDGPGKLQGKPHMREYAPPMVGQHALVSPGKKDANGNWVSSLPSDFTQPVPGVNGALHDVGQFLANKPGDSTFVNDLSTTGGVIKDAADKFNSNKAARLGARFVSPIVANGIGAISQLGDWGNKLRAAAAQKAAQAAAANAAQEAAMRARVQAASNAAAAAQAAQKAASYNFTTNTVKGVPGAPAIPAAVVKASNTPGTQQFNQKLQVGPTSYTPKGAWWQL